MKRTLVLLFILGSFFSASAQQSAQPYDTTAPYMKTKHIPEFSLLSIDSTVFTQNVLKKDKPVIFMLFHPECDHCQVQLELLLAMPELERSAELVLISGEEPLYKNRAFYNKNHLEKYPYVHLGKDFKYFFGSYFRPNTVPVLAFYDKKGAFVLMNRGHTEKEMVLKGIKD